MTEEQYKKLNYYLNIIFMELLKIDDFLPKNLSALQNTSEKFLEFVSDYELKENYNENSLTYEDIYKIAREIIESINKKYLPIYDKIIDNGILDFNYENDGSGSCCYIKNNNILIDVGRKFTYDDITCLVHEFIHYINNNNNTKRETINRYLFTEFISIYFEIYAQRYLLKKYDAPIDAIGIYSRLIDAQKCAEKICIYSIPFFAYEKNGNLSEKSYDFINECFEDETQENFEIKCKKLLEVCESVDQDYRHEILYEKEFNERDFGRYGIFRTGISRHYRYLLGTLLAYYSIDNIDINYMIKLNEFVNTDEASQLTPIDLLTEFGINMNDFLDKSLESIEKVLDGKKKTR